MKITPSVPSASVAPHNQYSLIRSIPNPFKQSRVLACCVAMVEGFLFFGTLSVQAGNSTMSFENQNYSVLQPGNLWQPSVAIGYQEQGIVIDSTTGSSNGNCFYLYPPSATSSYTGSKAVEPLMQSNVSYMYITRRGGRPFDMKSFKLFPRVAGAAASVDVVGLKPGGSTVSMVATSSTDLSGATINFGANFQNVLEVRLTRRSSTSFLRFQIDDIVIYEYPAIQPSGPLVTESAGEAFVNVSIESPDADIALNYQIIDGTATQPGDYTLPNGSATGTITIPASNPTAQLRIPIVNNTTVENLEQFTVNFFGNPSGTTFIGGSNAIVKIGDDDASTFALYVSNHGLTGIEALPGADPNADGISNLEAYLHRINPAGPSPAAWLDRRATYIVEGGNTPALRLTIPIPLPSDVLLAMEESTTLGPWSEQILRNGFGTGSLWTGSGASRVIESNSISERIITLPASQAIGSRPVAFLRMRYVLAAGGGRD